MTVDLNIHRKSDSFFRCFGGQCYSSDDLFNWRSRRESMQCRFTTWLP